MNANDRRNLEFLLTVSPEVLADWYSQADPIDLAYAAQLLNQAKTDVEMLSHEMLDDVEDVSDAAAYLTKFRN